MGVLLPIYMYHHVVPAAELPDDPHLYVTPDDLRAQIRQFKRSGFTFVTLSEAWRRIASGKAQGRAVVLTFDDLYSDFYEFALPVLIEESVRATGFAISGNVTYDNEPLPAVGGMLGLTATQLREIHAQGIEIGSHTISHRELTTLTDAELADELVESRRYLSECLLGAGVDTFCHPRGKLSRRVMAAVESAGYACAVSTMRGNVHCAEERFRLKRIRAGRERIGFSLRYSTWRLYDLLNRKRRASELSRLEAGDAFPARQSASKTENINIKANANTNSNT